MASRIYSLGEGTSMLKAARNAIELKLESPLFRKEMLDGYMAGLDRRVGIMISLESHPDRVELGTGGSLTEEKKPSDVLVQYALDAAFNDRNGTPISMPVLNETVLKLRISSSVEVLPPDPKLIEKAYYSERKGICLSMGFGRCFAFPEEADSLREHDGTLLDILHRRIAPLPAPVAIPCNVHSFRLQTFSEDYPGGSISEEGFR